MAKIKEFKNIIILIFYHGASSVHIWCTSVIDLHVRVEGHYRVNFKHYPCHYSIRIELILALFIGELFIFTNFNFFYKVALMKFVHCHMLLPSLKNKICKTLFDTEFDTDICRILAVIIVCVKIGWEDF